jgi:hypothetical protein
MAERGKDIPITRVFIRVAAKIAAITSIDFNYGDLVRAGILMASKAQVLVIRCKQHKLVLAAKSGVKGFMTVSTISYCIRCA